METVILSSADWVNKTVEQQIARCTEAVPLPQTRNDNDGKVRVIDKILRYSCFFILPAFFKVEIQQIFFINIINDSN